MKTLATTILLSSLLMGCSSLPPLPSHHEMSCKDLKEKEKSLQSEFKLNNVGSVLAAIVDLAEDTNESATDAISSDVDLNATKRELRDIQSVIHQKRCK